MAEHARCQCQQVHQHKRAKRRRLRQQQIQNCGGSRNIKCGDQQLQAGQARAGQAQRAPTELDQQAVSQRLLGQPAPIEAGDQQCTQHQYRNGDGRQYTGRHA
ncbi:hypothetical protein PS631_05037 [Pseudomonas fluorescens]|nr:hypothetical protein PS631_05037 [Pseudomonas fluorescens]